MTLDGGGVAVSQAVHGPAGWSVAPCQSSTSANWYFASRVHRRLQRPLCLAPQPDVVTRRRGPRLHDAHGGGAAGQLPGGRDRPGRDAGRGRGVRGAERLPGEHGGHRAYRPRRRVGGADVRRPELRPLRGAGAAASPSPTGRFRWPQETPGGGDSEIDVFNPGTVPEKVTVHLRLASGPLAPLANTVAPGETWSLATSRQTRIPVGASYSAEVDATGGPGVVVSRAVAAPAAATAPQAGVAVAVDGLTSATPANEWIVPPPGTQCQPRRQRCGPRRAGRPQRRRRSADVPRLRARAGHPAPVGVGHASRQVRATSCPGSTLATAGFDPIVVRGDGPMAVSEDFTPSGVVGVVGMPGIALAAPHRSLTAQRRWRW